MSFWKKDIILVNTGDKQFLVAQLNYTVPPSSVKVKWKKRIFTEEELVSVRFSQFTPLIWSTKDDGEFIGQGMAIQYEFKKSDENRYIKFYAYVNEYSVIQQSEIFFIQAKHNTDVRVRSVQSVSDKAIAGETVKYTVGYSQPKQGSKVSKDVKWMVRVDGVEKRLIINDKVMLGGEISFEVPREWKGKSIMLMPFINKHTPRISTTLCVLHDPLDEIHIVQEEETIQEISTMCGVSIDHLKSINPNIDIQNLSKNQKLNIFPEKHFKLNLMTEGAYLNPNYDEGKRMEIDDLTLIGVDFYRPAWAYHRYLPTNLIIEGKALEQIKGWFKVVELVEQGKKMLKEKGSSEYEHYFWTPGSITDYPQDWLSRKKEQIEKALDRTWEDVEEVEDFFNWVHVIGSFRITIRKHADETKVIVTVYDSKTFDSGSDRRFPRWVVENAEKVLTPTYQRYIWIENL